MSEAKMPTDNLAEQLRAQYPSNSKMHPPPKKEREHLEKMVSAEVKVQKEGLGKKFAKAFFSEDIRDVKKYVVYDLVIPGVKRAFLATMERLLFSGTGGYGFWGGGPTNYNKQYQQSQTRVTYNSSSYGPAPTPNVIDTNGVKQITYRTRADAENVLRELLMRIDSYGEVSLSQYYELCGISYQFVDEKWGWKDLRTTRLYPVAGGYCLSLPAPILLD